jgi:N-methylhydantoinase A
VEMVNLRVRASGHLQDESALRPAAVQDGDGEPSGERAIEINGRCQRAAVYERARLAPRQRLSGPAVVEQADATVVIAGGWFAVVDPFGNLVLEQEADA